MAQNNSSQETVVDLEDLEVNILILAKNPNNLKNANAFLNRRGWPTGIVGSVSKAIEYAADLRPDFVLISLNHPNPAAMRLPELISQTFNIICVGFVEGTDAASVQRLSSFKMRYKVFGQPSGPNIQRGIRRILSEQFNLKEDESKLSQGQKDVVFANQGQPQKSAGFKVIQGESKTDSGTAAFVAPGAKARKRLKDFTGPSNKNASGNMLFGQSTEKVAPPQPLPADSKELAGMLKKSLFGDGGENDKQYEAQAIAEQVQLETLEKCMTSAMKKVCHADSEAPRPIHQVSRVGVFPVDSMSAPGYFVVAFEADHADEVKNFLRDVERALQEALLAAGFAGKVEDGFWLEIPPVDFDQWVQEMGTFNFKIDHHGLEVGAVFFQSPKPLARPKPSHDNSMYTVPVAEISTDYPVNFKAYLHLNENHKFYLYLRNGRQLQPEQKERLLENQITDLFMKSVDLHNLRMFLAAVYLRDTIKLKGSNEAA